MPYGISQYAMHSIVLLLNVGPDPFSVCNVHSVVLNIEVLNMQYDGGEHAVYSTVY